MKFNVKKYIKFDFRIADILLVIGISLVIILLKLYGINEIPENSLFENIQVIVLAFATVYCLYQRRKNPEYKAINTFFAMVLFLMTMRELSYGRCIFCCVEGSTSEFYPWSYYKYGYLANIVVLLYVAAFSAYGLINEIWKSIWQALKTVKFPLVSAIILIVAIVATLTGEKVFDSTFIEENAEFLAYCTIFTMLYYYNSLLIKHQ